VLHRIVLVSVFTLSFLTYFAPELSITLQAAPLALFALLVLFKAVSSDSLLTVLAGFFETDSLLYVIFLSALMFLASFQSPFDKAVQFSFLLSISLIFARIYMTMVPIHEVLEAFYWSAILSILIFLPLSLATIIHSILTFERFSPFNFHPNLLALLFAGYLCVMIWKCMKRSWPSRILSGSLGLVCVGGIFLASSRGAIVGIAAAGVFGAALTIFGASKQRRKKLLGAVLVTGILLLALLMSVQNLESTQNFYTALDQVLALSSPDRGLDSGMTGRVDVWQAALRVFNNGTWLLGHGLRSSDAAFISPSIDNSYLVILYDMGLLPLMLITWRFTTILSRVVRKYFRADHESSRHLYLTCSMFLVVLLVTAIVERSLFAVGNPFSLLAFLFFATPTSIFECERVHLDSDKSANLILNRMGIDLA